MAVKFIVQLYSFQMRNRIWDERTKQKWNDMLIRMAKEYRENALKLGGVLIKVGQFLGMRADIMPEVFTRQLTGLADRVPAMPFSYAKHLLEQEWGGDIYRHLAWLEESTYSSASIGEVYRATLKDGTDVAIKVQRYKVQEIYHMDFKALKIVFWILSTFTSFGKKADLSGLYQELIFVMDRELDFRQELYYGNYFKGKYGDFAGLHIPDYYEKLSTKKVLVMEWIDGEKVTNMKFLNSNQIAAEHIAKVLFDFYMDQFLSNGYFHADPHAGNILVQQDGTVVILDFGMVGEIRRQDTHYFKRLVQCFILDDYEAVINILEEMDFILPGANKNKLRKVLQQTMEAYGNGSVKRMDARTMDQITKDIRMVIKDQPIQVPADYLYLGRAISIICGILLGIYPEIDMQEWAKPKIKQWVGGRSLTETVYKQIAKDTVQPVLSFPKAMLGWLENGEKDRQWEREKQQTKLKHHFYLLLEILSFVLIIISTGITIYAHYMVQETMELIGISVTGMFILILLFSFVKHYHMIQSHR
jgi:predicted unusual protein kinase regulating ubiquinone biosynthesis (AarF/ABC1/UbiB family)